MSIHNRFLRGLSALVLATVASVIAWVLLGVIAPIWIMQLIFGAEEVHSAPAHGAAILFLTVPLGGLLALLALVGLTFLFYVKFTPR